MKTLLVLAAATAAASSFAQVSFTGATYYQDFDTLAPTGAANPWTNNPGGALLGWYADTGIATYEADYGISLIPGLMSYGENASGLNPFERALGSMIQVPGSLARGLRLTNTSGNTLGSITVDYFGEQWRGSGTGAADVINFEYNGSATGIASPGYTAVVALNFVAPNVSFLGALDGNLAANRTLKTATIGGLNWLNGTDMWLRWTHNGFQRQGLGIDEVHITGAPVPEPFTMVLAASALGLALRRRSAKVSNS